MIAHALMVHNLAFREDHPTISDSSTDQDHSKLERWETSNRMCLMLIKHSIPSVFRGIVSDEVVLAKDYLVALEKSFAKNNKDETITLLADLVSMRYQGTDSIREYILKMSNTTSNTKALGLSLADDVIVCLVLISLPGQFAHFKVSYNCQKEKWSLNELIAQCVQEEERLSKEKAKSAHVATTSKGKSPKSRMKKRAADSGHGPSQKK
ncbi:hypothetical protein BRARA_J00640 [Brassica rapa]|uniref:UBN2 domain-containing protein n=1 Tax=Brassica campestris TaxID=3711 RepID=A0A397XK54_BRACM|nr:hypothetical protein BRARA_J00640 [Brassica rapa]